jgi:hypothetical protein
MGPVLGVDATTGAGGANVWTQDLLKQLLEQPTPDPDSPYKALPRGAGMRVSIRRTLRVGAFAGTPVEDLGVVSDERHQITRNDLLNANADLMDHAGKLLAGMTVRKLEVAAALNGGDLRLDLDVTNVDRADIYVDGRPRASVDTPAGASSVTIDGVAGATVVRAEGFADDKLVAARTVNL